MGSLKPGPPLQLDAYVVDRPCAACVSSTSPAQVLETERECLEHDRAELVFEQARSMLPK